MKIARVIMRLAVVALAATLSGVGAQAQTAASVEARNVVLVHGAWADGSSWAEVIPLLQAAGLKVTAVQNPLTSLQDSVRRCWSPTPGAAPSSAKWGPIRRSPLSSMSRRARRMPGKISSPFQENFQPERCGPASRSTMVSPDYPRSPSTNTSQTASSPRKQRCSTPCRSPPPPPCSADEPRRQPGAPSPHGMRYRSRINPLPSRHCLIERNPQ